MEINNRIHYALVKISCAPTTKPTGLESWLGWIDQAPQPTVLKT
jgi:hypothetical protein